MFVLITRSVLVLKSLQICISYLMIFDDHLSWSDHESLIVRCSQSTQWTVHSMTEYRTRYNFHIIIIFEINWGSSKSGANWQFIGDRLYRNLIHKWPWHLANPIYWFWPKVLDLVDQLMKKPIDNLPVSSVLIIRNWPKPVTQRLWVIKTNTTHH